MSDWDLEKARKALEKAEKAGTFEAQQVWNQTANIWAFVALADTIDKDRRGRS